MTEGLARPSRRALLVTACHAGAAGAAASAAGRLMARGTAASVGVALASAGKAHAQVGLERGPAIDWAPLAPRDVQLWLPPGYAASGARRYPVLYLHDGQNLFDPSAWHGGWRAGDTAMRAVASGQVAPFILVAIHNTPQRLDDYTPMSRVWRGQQRGGAGAAYADRMLQALKPAIDAQWRTLPGPQHTAVGGASLAGLHAMWMALQFPQHIGCALCVSPAVWWDEAQTVARQLAGWPAQGLRPRLWVSVGDAEDEGEALNGARLWHAAAVQGGWKAAADDAGSLSYRETPGAAHNEAAWAAQFEAMLRMAFGTA